MGRVLQRYAGSRGKLKDPSYQDVKKCANHLHRSKNFSMVIGERSVMYASLSSMLKNGLTECP
jgi:hypothetical protein